MRKILSYKAVQLVVVLIITVILSVILTAVKDKEYSNWVSTEAVITDWKTGWHVSHIVLTSALYFHTYYITNPPACIATKRQCRSTQR
ncbi:MAG: hypothetical protein ACLTTQ_07695 [Christensenellales bacterium]